MAMKSTFYDTAPGEGVGEKTWAESARSRGAAYGVSGPTDLRLTAHATSPYVVNISPGEFWGHGVWDVSDTTVSVTSTAPATNAVRWDTIVARRNWQPTAGGPTSFVSVPGTTAKAISGNREKRPGIIDDQPLYLVQWRGGRSQPEQIIDLRCWAAPGGIEINDELARTYLAFPGTVVNMGKRSWRYVPAGNNTWDWDENIGETAKVGLALTYLYTADPPRGDNLVQESPSAYLDRNRVHLSGVMSNNVNVEYSGGISYSLAQVPAGLRPAKAEYFTVEVAFTLCRVWVRPDGHIYFMFANRVGPLGPRLWRFSLSGISYAVAR